MLIRREGGTFSDREVILHPGPRVLCGGASTVTYSVTSDTDHTLNFGKKPRMPLPAGLASVGYRQRGDIFFTLGALVYGKSGIS